MQTLFYAAADDLIPVFAAIEPRHRIVYTLCGSFPSRNVSSFSSGAALPSLRSPPPQDSAIACPAYLVTLAETPISVREVPHRNGAVRYAVDQLQNPDSITVQIGGFYRPDVLLHGRIATVSKTPVSTQLYRAFISAIRKLFTPIQAFHVGPHAQQLWKRGCRLTIAVQSPPEYDLSAT
jgi:hypothetical protein